MGLAIGRLCLDIITVDNKCVMFFSEDTCSCCELSNRAKLLTVRVQFGSHHSCSICEDNNEHHVSDCKCLLRAAP